MNGAGLPANVRDFVLRHITSVEQVELLLLFVADPTRSWTIAQLVNELRSSEQSVSLRVKQLLANRFLTCQEDTFRFAPDTPEKAAVCQDLAGAYREYRVRVIELIYSEARALKSFSDAFKLKPEK